MNSASRTEISSTLSLGSTGYIELDGVNFHAVVREWAVPAVIEAMSEDTTLYEWAARQSYKVEMRGRGTVYAVALPGTPEVGVVVRRNSHGGLLRKLSGDIFTYPTRAPHELAMSFKLLAAGVLTPEIIAYVIYPLCGVFARSDVVTRRLPFGADVPTLWPTVSEVERNALLLAMARLLKTLEQAGARHADLNLKNIYITSEKLPVAYLLDVDRVVFPSGSGVAACNFERLSRSIRKWRTRWDLDFGEDYLVRLAKFIDEV